MARFELVLSLAKRNDDNELYTEETGYVCFCKNLKDLEEITDTANEVIKEEIGESEEGEVLFGSADVFIKDKVKLKITFKDKDCDVEEIENLLNLILDKTDQTIH